MYQHRLFHVCQHSTDAQNSSLLRKYIHTYRCTYLRMLETVQFQLLTSCQVLAICLQKVLLAYLAWQVLRTGKDSLRANAGFSELCLQDISSRIDFCLQVHRVSGNGICFKKKDELFGGLDHNNRCENARTSTERSLSYYLLGFKNICYYITSFCTNLLPYLPHTILRRNWFHFSRKIWHTIQMFA